jgi:hypothetical protein
LSLTVVVVNAGDDDDDKIAMVEVLAVMPTI